MISYLIISVSQFDPFKLVDWSSIAACVDCDGSIIVKIVKQKESIGIRLSLIIQVSQHVDHIAFLENIQHLLGVGTVAPRKGQSNMADWEVIKLDEVKYVAEQILPYLRVKKQQTLLLLDILNVYKNLPACRNVETTAQRAEGIYFLLSKIDQLAALNANSNRKNNGQVALNIMQARGFLLDKNYP